MNRRYRTVVLGAIPVLALSLVVSSPTIPGTNISLAVPFAAQGPGPSFNTLGEFKGKPVVDIKGTEVDSTEGNLNMTTVSVYHNMSLVDAVSRWLSTDDTFVPIDQIFPRDRPMEEVEQENQQAFLTSESSATLAAMHYLNRPTQVEVAAVVDDSAATGKLNKDDIIEAVDGVEVTEPGQVREAVQKKQPGDDIVLRIKHDNEVQEQTITLGKNPKDENLALLGVTMGARPTDGVEVEYNLEDIGGPSAGLMFSMAVVDKLSPGELSGGKFIAGTGTIDEVGTVGPVGGVEHKVRSAKDLGAEVFLSPAENCGDATKNRYDNLTVIKVSTLDDAIKQLKAYNSGQEYNTCN